MQGTASTADTPNSAAAVIERQSPIGWQALVEHMAAHGLGSPQSITAPSAASPYFAITVPSMGFDAWVVRGLAVDDVQTRPVAGGEPIGGRCWERVEVTGRLIDLGIRVKITAHRPVLDQLHLLDGSAS